MKMENGKMKTRCYYTDYINHCIRFFLSTPDTLKMDGKRKADIDNWLAVQAVFYNLPEQDKQTIMGVYKAHYRISEGAKIYAEQTGKDINDVWRTITKTSALIARKRGLI